MSHLVKSQIKSSAEHKRNQFVSRLTLLVLSVTAVYILLDWMLGFHVTIFIYIIFIGSAMSIYILNRIGRAQFAKVTGLLLFNINIFVVASSEPFATGMHLYLFAAGTVALTMYDFNEWPKSLFFACLSTVLYLLVYLDYFSVIPERNFSQDQSRLFFVINTFVNASICIYSFLMFSKLNYDAENNLHENEELMRQQNEQLTKANSELDRFVYSVSHDLRAPLSSISGLIQLLERTSDPVETRQYVHLMKGRIERLEEFIRDIINFSRNARTEIQTESTNVGELVNETFEALKFMKGAEAIVLQNELPDSLSISIDKTRFQIVLFNIISNAIQYKDSNKGQSYIRFGFELSEEHLILQIDDNGIGIDHPHHPKVFNMFYRASEKAKGSGLGLYIVKETMDKLGGTISLQSVLGEGTRFTLQLPAQTN